MPTDPLDDLAEARAKIEATREALRQAPGDVPEIRAAITRLERLVAEVAKVEGVVESQAVPSLTPSL